MNRPVLLRLPWLALLCLCFGLVFTCAAQATAVSSDSGTGGSNGGSAQSKPVSAPRPDLAPDQVVKIVAEAMQQNDEKDNGIETVFRFASPGNKEATGPLERFAKMVKGPAYAPMINCKAVEYGELKKNDAQAEQQITVTTADGAKIKYLFGLSKQPDGAFKDCWMTDAVIRITPFDDPAPRQIPGPAPVKT